MKIKLLFLTLICLASCTGNTIFKAPDDLIEEDEMVALLTDMYLASAAVHKPSNQGNKNLAYMQLIYQKYEIDSSRFKKSNDYYTTKIDVYEKMMLQVQENLNQLKDSLKAIKLDSIKPTDLPMP